MRAFNARLIALALVLGCIVLGDIGPGAKFRRRAGEIHHRRFQRHRRGGRRRRGERQQDGRADHLRAAGRPPAVQRQSQKGFHQGRRRQAHRCRDRRSRPPPRPPISRRCASTTGCGARIEAAIGGLTLLAPDPQKRLEAAQAVFKSRDEKALPALDAAHRQGNQCQHQARDAGSARRHPVLSADATRAGRQDRRHRRDPRPRRPGGA